MGEKGKILVVEDDVDSRNALCVMLQSLGYEYVAFGSAKEALAGIQGQPLSLAMLDIMMPEMNGYELLAELKKIPDLQKLPIIMVTAKDGGEEIIEGYKSGADYYITKPFRKNQIEYGIKLYLEELEKE